jgi:hypothetical protein
VFVDVSIENYHIIIIFCTKETIKDILFVHVLRNRRRNVKRQSGHRLYHGLAIYEIILALRLAYLTVFYFFTLRLQRNRKDNVEQPNQLILTNTTRGHFQGTIYIVFMTIGT